MPGRWKDPSYRYLIRRIQEEDRDRQFVTGFQEFDDYDDPNDYGTLRDYWKKDQLADRSTTAYLLFDLSRVQGDVIGVLRYRYEGQVPSVDELHPGEGPYLYLSRVGVVHDRQGTRLGSMLLEFFYHLVLREMQRARLSHLVIWWKCTERTLTFVRPLSQTGEINEFARKRSQKWGEVLYLRLEVDIRV